MNLTEWITKEDLSIKQFTEEFCNVVIENFGEHNYKCVNDIVREKLATTELETEASDVQCEYCNNKGAKPINAYQCDKCGMVFLSEH